MQHSDALARGGREEATNSHSAPVLLQLDAIDDASLGGKALGLARLTGMGLAVPPAVVLRNASADTFPAELDATVAELGAERLAVRSSAVGEDGLDASFAGQYDTVLNVSGPQALRAAITRCVESGGHAHAASYRRDKLNDAGARMHVVIQAMVDNTRVRMEILDSGVVVYEFPEIISRFEE